MPLQNRVLPTGDIVVDPARGLFTGNRGIIHRADHRLSTARWAHTHWISCTLTHPKGLYHGPMPDRRWTALFFLDEAVAMAAGHRPCAYCRRSDYTAFTAAWAASTGATPSHTVMDRALHRARVTRHRAQVRHHAPMNSLPDFAFVLIDGTAHLVRGDHIYPYQPAGYGPALPRPTGIVTVLTPRPMLDVLAPGYQPIVAL